MLLILAKWSSSTVAAWMRSWSELKAVRNSFNCLELTVGEKGLLWVVPRSSEAKIEEEVPPIFLKLLGFCKTPARLRAFIADHGWELSGASKSSSASPEVAPANMESVRLGPRDTREFLGLMAGDSCLPLCVLLVAALFFVGVDVKDDGLKESQVRVWWGGLSAF